MLTSVIFLSSKQHVQEFCKPRLFRSTCTSLHSKQPSKYRIYQYVLVIPKFYEIIPPKSDRNLKITKRESVRPKMTTEDPQIESSRSDAVAVALAFAAGALFIAVALYAHRSPASSDARSNRIASAGQRAAAAAESAEELRRQSRVRAFIDNQVAVRDVVLFVDSASSCNASHTHFQRLFDAIFPVATTAPVVTVAIVDLATTVQGKKILEALQGSSSHIEHDLTQLQHQQMEFLFVKGVLLGDYSRVRQLLISGSLASELLKQGVACDLSGIHVAKHSDAGFFVLGPQNCFQTVNSMLSSEAAAEANSDALRLETHPLDTVEELLSADATSLLLQPPRIPLAERARNPLRRSKLLVCHDMQGGYLSDRFTQVQIEISGLVQ